MYSTVLHNGHVTETCGEDHAFTVVGDGEAVMEELGGKLTVVFALIVTEPASSAYVSGGGGGGGGGWGAAPPPPHVRGPPAFRE